MQAGVATQLETVEAVTVGDFVGSRLYVVAGRRGIYRRIQNSAKSSHPSAIPAMFQSSDSFKVIYLVEDLSVRDELARAGVLPCTATDGKSEPACEEQSSPSPIAAGGVGDDSELPAASDQLEL